MVILVTVMITVYSTIRTSSFQQLAGRIAADFLSRNYNLEVYLDKIRISGSLALDVSGLKVMDHHHHELLQADEISLHVRDLSLRDGNVRLSYISLHNTAFSLHTYAEDSVSNLTFLLKKIASSSPDTVEKPAKKPLEIHCDGLTLDNLSFAFTDEHYAHSGEVMDFKDILLTDVFLFANDISVVGDSISAVIKHLSCTEKSGFRLNDFKAKASVSASGIRTNNLEVVSRGTNVRMDLEFLYNGWDKLSYFLDSVYINAHIHESVLTLADIGYFTKVLKPMDDPVLFSGEVNGPVSDFKAEDFKFNLGNFTEFQGDIAITGIPDMDSAYHVLEIEKFVFTASDIESFSLPLTQPNLSLPKELHHLGIASLTGRVEGTFTDFQVDVILDSDVGGLVAYGSLRNDPVLDEPVYFGNINGSSINLGVITGVADLGLTDLDLEFEGKSFDINNLEALINGWIKNFEFKGYRYEKFIFGGQLKGLSYDGRLIALDPGLSLAFTGDIDFNEASPSFDFKLEIDQANLFDLHLADRSEDMQLRGQLTGKFSGITPDDFNGRISMNKLAYQENGLDYELENLLLERVMQSDGHEKLTVASDILDAEVIGNLDLNSFTGDLLGLFLDHKSHPKVNDPRLSKSSALSFDIRFKNLQPVTELFLPSVRISQGTGISGNIDFANLQLDLNVHSDSVLIGGIMLDSIAISGQTDEKGRVKLLAGIGMIAIGKDQDTVTVGIPNFQLATDAGNDSIFCKIEWDNGDELRSNRAEISGYVLIPNDYRLEADIIQADANFNGTPWKLEGESQVVIDTAFKEVRDLIITRPGESLFVNGRLSDNATDTLNLQFKNWSLSNFNSFLQNTSLSLGGIINGSLHYSKVKDVPDIYADIKIDDFIFNEVLFGNASILIHWIESDQALSLNVDIYSNASKGDPYKILGLDGFYYPFDQAQNFDLDIATQNLDISVVEPLIASFSSYIAGFATGKVNLLGTVDKPILTGRMKLQRGEIKIDYLNVTYSFSNEIIIEEDFIHFDRAAVYDPYSNEGYIQGGIRHKFFRDINLDLRIEPNNFLALDLNRYQNETFYGTAYATGTVNITGPLNNLAMKVMAKTEKGTDVHIPINYSVDVSQGDFIVFTDQVDTVAKEYEHDILVEGVSLDIELDVTKDANIEISLPGDIGYIKANGSGLLRLGVDAAGYLTLKGSYVIQSGLFLFSLEELVSRRFEILEGSSISWTGDINEADVNIVARYRLRTSLTGLGSTLIDPDAATQKVVVYTDIRMTGDLFNPELSFGIYFPNMREQDRQAVYAVLDTLDQGLMNQQALSLLVLNSFSTSGAGVSNPVNPAAIMSNTLSSMLSQISNDFNIGINYVPGDRVTDEQLEVALSTQLLNDRLIIDGNLDVSTNDNNTQGTSSIVGDVNVEYKLTPDGRFRIKAFNRSNDLSLLNNYSPYTQGVGIFYRREFQDLHDLFTSKKARKMESEQ